MEEQRIERDLEAMNTLSGEGSKNVVPRKDKSVLDPTAPAFHPANSDNNCRGEGSNNVVAAVENFVLDPTAPAFQPGYSDNKCLFLTFSNGFPLTERQIYDFFEQMFPNYVERVYVHQPSEEDKPPLFGKVMFTRSMIPELFMRNKERVSVCVEGRLVYCRRFVTYTTKSGGTSVATTSEEDTAGTSRREGGSDNGGDE